MTAMSDDTEAGFTELAADLAKECEGLSLIDADRALDDARRFLWLRQFSGASRDALFAGMISDHLDTARRIADRLDGIVTPMEAETVFLETRTLLWMKTFAAVPGSLFAHQLRAHVERHDPDEKLH